MLFSPLVRPDIRSVSVAELTEDTIERVSQDEDNMKIRRQFADVVISTRREDRVSGRDIERDTFWGE